MIGANAAIAAGAGLLGQTAPHFWMPVEASTSAGQVDRLFNFILAISIVFFLLVVFLMTWFVLRYRRRPGVEAVKTATHNTPLELAWSLIPLGLVILIFIFGFRSYLDMTVPPENALDIQVHAQKWAWQFTYPNGYTDATLHVPIGTPVRLVLSSEDVIHSLFIPTFRIKKDVVPGRYNQMWFQATVVGQFPIYCTQYCGAGHSDMLSSVFVHEPGGYEKWLANAASQAEHLPPPEAGLHLYKTRGCASCHTIDGSRLVGPSFKGVFGHQVPLSDGTSVMADENYVRESILLRRPRLSEATSR